LNLADAERHILKLINADRAQQGLKPVQWDPVAARAGRAHAEDMAHYGYTAHWGTDGSVPELRYTESGGMDMVQENAGCFADAKQRELDPNPMFDPADIERVETAFLSEKPPNDGHRRNILTAWHTHVGVGLTKAKGVPIACMAQEFVDRYGSYGSVPKQAKVGQKIKVTGTVAAPAKFVGVGLARVPLPAARTAEDLEKTNTYAIPAPFVTYFPKGFVTPVPVEVKGRDFSIEIALTQGGRSGLYEVSVWAEVPGHKDFVMISLRTIRAAN